MTNVEWLVGVLFVKPAVVLAIAAVIVALLRRQSAGARHAVWAGALIAVLSLPLLAAVLPPLGVPVLTPARVQSPPTFPAIDGIEAGSVTFAARAPAASSGESHALRNGGPGNPIGRVLLATWGLVALLLGRARIAAALRVQRVLRRARPVSSPHVAHLFRRAALRCGIRRTVQLYVSDDVTAPVVAGLRRPAVLLPVAAEGWADADLSAIFVHELAHVARRDGLVHFLAGVTAAVYWCNPVVRFAVRRLSEECERACDDRVLRTGTAAHVYADVLLRVAAATRSGVDLPAPAIPMVRFRELESRLRAVLDPGVGRRPLSHRRAAACAAVLATVGLSTAAFVPVPRPQQLPQQPPEPDQRGDSVAAPASERLPLANPMFRVTAEAAAALHGPDSLLVRQLIAALARQPTGDADLVRERAAWALAQIRDRRLVEPLLDALQSTDWRVQSYAAWALIAARDPRAVAPLLPLLAHPVWRLRAMAAAALDATADPRAASAMERALADPAWQVRIEAVEYFARLRGPALAERLTPRLSDRHIAVRNAAARALHR